MPLVVIGLSHRSSSVVVRERFAFAEARIPGALQSLRDSGIAEEAVILSTCNRVEIYAVTPLDGPARSPPSSSSWSPATITATRLPTSFTS